MRRKLLRILVVKNGYILVSAEKFQNQDRVGTIYEAFQSVAHPTLVIDCSSEYDKSETDLFSSSDSFSEKTRIIFIAVTDVTQSLQDKFKEY